MHELCTPFACSCLFLLLLLLFTLAFSSLACQTLLRCTWWRSLAVVIRSAPESWCHRRLARGRGKKKPCPPLRAADFPHDDAEAVAAER